MKFYNFKFFSLNLLISLIFNLLPSEYNANSPVIKMQEFKKEIMNSYQDKNKIKIEFDKESNVVQNRIRNNILLLSGIDSGKKLILEKIKAMAASIIEDKNDLFNLNFTDILRDSSSLASTIIELSFKEMIERSVRNNKTIVFLFDNIEFFAKDYKKFAYNPFFQQIFQDCLKKLIDGISAIKNNSNVFFVAISHDDLNEIDNNILKLFGTNIINIGMYELEYLKQNYHNFDEKPKITKINIIEESLDNPKFSEDLKKNPEDLFPDKEKRYIKTNLMGITGCMPASIYEIMVAIQENNGSPIKLSNSDNLQNKFILCGPQGTGKTSLVKTIAKVTDGLLIEINGPDLLTGYVNHASKKIGKYFEEAKNCLLNFKYKNVIIFIDEVDTFTKSNSGNSSESQYHADAAAKLWQCLDEISDNNRIYVFVATNKHKKIENSFTSRCISIEIPNPTKTIRKETVLFYMKYYNLEISESDINKIIQYTENASLRDIQRLFQRVSCKLEMQKKLVDPTFKQLSISDRIDSALNDLHKELIKRKELNEKEEINEKLLKEQLQTAMRSNDPERVKEEDKLRRTNLKIARNTLRKQIIDQHRDICGTIGGGVGLYTGYACSATAVTAFETTKIAAENALGIQNTETAEQKLNRAKTATIAAAAANCYFGKQIGDCVGSVTGHIHVYGAIGINKIIKYFKSDSLKNSQLQAKL